MRKHLKGLPGRRNLTLPSLAPIIIPLDGAVLFGLRPLQDHAFLFLSQANEQEAILTGQGFAKVSPHSVLVELLFPKEPRSLFS